MPTDIEKFVQDVSKMRDAQKVYFNAKRNPQFSKEEVQSCLIESKRLEKIVDEQLKEREPNLFNF